MHDTIYMLLIYIWTLPTILKEASLKGTSTEFNLFLKLVSIKIRNSTTWNHSWQFQTMLSSNIVVSNKRICVHTFDTTINIHIYEVIVPLNSILTKLFIP